MAVPGPRLPSTIKPVPPPGMRAHAHGNRSYQISYESGATIGNHLSMLLQLCPIGCSGKGFCPVNLGSGTFLLSKGEEFRLTFSIRRRTASLPNPPWEFIWACSLVNGVELQLDRVLSRVGGAK